MTDIDRSAPVIVAREIVIDAPVDTVWGLHVAVDAWPTWNSAITSVELDVPLAEGVSFAWHAGDLEIRSTVYEVQPGRRTVWGGQTLGIDGVHTWTFEALGDRTRVGTEESWAGAPVDQDPDGMRKALDQSLHTWLTELKQAAETPRRSTRHEDPDRRRGSIGRSSPRAD